ncbi:MAG: hypothetical protein ACRCZE_01990 [Candidatus Altimarinota bacterium]
MNKMTKASAVGGLLVVSMALYGCQGVGAPAPSQQAPEKAAEEVVQDGIAKLSDVKAYTFDLNVTGDLKGPAGSPPESVKFNMSFDGGLDVIAANDPKMNLKLEGTFDADADGATAAAEIKMNKEAIFFNLMSLEGRGSVAVPQEILDQYAAKWWKLPIPPEALEEFAQSLPQGGDENLTPEQKEMKDLVKNTKFFKDIKFASVESISGEDSYKYTAVLDEAAFTDFVVKSSEMQGTTMSETEIADLKKGFEYFDFAGEIYVGKNSGVMNKMLGTLTFVEDAELGNPSGKVTVEMTIADLNKAITVDAPAEAEEVPLEALMGLPL